MISIKRLNYRKVGSPNAPCVNQQLKKKESDIKNTMAEKNM